MSSPSHLGGSARTVRNSATGRTQCLALMVAIAILFLFTQETNASAYKEIQAKTFRTAYEVNATWGSNVALSRNGKSAVVASSLDSVQFLMRSPYGWVEHGARVTIPGAVTNSNGIKGFGSSLGMSADGKTAVIGGSLFSGFKGGAWVFALAANRTWVQDGPALEGGTSILYAANVAISDDGKTVAIAAMKTNFLSVTVYVRDSISWTQQDILGVPNSPSVPAIQKQVVALSANGNLLATGGDDSNNRGLVLIFQRSNNEWSQPGSKIIGSGAASGTFFGSSLAFTPDGKTLLVGGPGKKGPGNETNMGAVWVYTWNAITANFTQQGAPLVPSKLFTSTSANFGSSLSISTNGKTFIVGAPDDDASSGSCFVYRRVKNNWVPTRIAPSSFAGKFGISLGLSGDAKVFTVGAPLDDGRNGTVWFYDTSSNPCKG